MYIFDRLQEEKWGKKVDGRIKYRVEKHQAKAVSKIIELDK